MFVFVNALRRCSVAGAAFLSSWRNKHTALAGHFTSGSTRYSPTATIASGGGDFGFKFNIAIATSPRCGAASSGNRLNRIALASARDSSDNFMYAKLTRPHAAWTHWRGDSVFAILRS